MPKLNIVVLDGKFANPGDLSWDHLKEYGKVTIYDHSVGEEVISRAVDADVIVINKVVIRKEELDQLPKLKLIVISATGMNNVDLEGAKKRHIPVKNVNGYSTNSVAQHTWAMILALINKVDQHSQEVKNGLWDEQVGFSFTLGTIPELAGKKLGIYGLGEIGRKVAQIGQAFGMEILVTSNHAKAEDYPDFELLSLKEMFKKADLISLHAPLRDDNHEIVNKELMNLMKPSALLINTARGPLIHEMDLCEILAGKSIAGAALDVLSIEPPGKDHALFKLENCLITPHIAWTTLEARATLIEKVGQHIAEFSENVQ